MEHHGAGSSLPPWKRTHRDRQPDAHLMDGQMTDSVSTRRLTLPPETEVLTRGDATALGAEAPHLDEWIDRGH